MPLENKNFKEFLVGKWEMFDTLNNVSLFNINKKQNANPTPPFKEVYFLPNGEKYWIFEGWEENKLFVHYGGDDPVLCFNFNIKTINNNNFMFLNVIDYDNNAFIMVLKQINNKKYNIFEIGRRENINIPYVLDNKILGKWNSVGYVQNIDDYTGKQSNNTLWLKSITFNDDGTVLREYFDESWQDKWTKGKLLDQKKCVASCYTFKTINNKEYMFLEWKMGNYVYGGMPAEYYVFVKDII